MMRYGFGWSAYGVLMMIPMIVIFIAFIYLLVKIFNNSDRHTSIRQPQNNSLKAIDILNERFANGEITEEEYKNKKEQILK